MKRKNISAFILIVLIGLGIWRYKVLYENENTRRSELPSSRETQKPTESPRQVPKKEVFLSIQDSDEDNTQNPYAKKPKGNIIEFQIVDGLAIAYGDIILGKPEPDFQGSKGHYEVSAPLLWEKPEIAYAIASDLPNPQRVEKAIEYFRQNTPIRFVPYSGQRDAIVFEAGTEHCFSALGKVGGLQPIRLSADCQPQHIIHEVMHALGFVHEQSRPDRDRFVEVNWENIETKYHAQFAMVPDSLLEAMKDSPFDYHSIMLYQPNAFAIQPNLFTLRSTEAEAIAPVQNGLSETDLKRLNKLYNLYE